MSTLRAEREHLVELLTCHATEGISLEDERLMETLLPRHPDLDSASFEVAAAVIDRTFSEAGDLEPMPDGLEDRLLEQAAAWRLTHEPTPSRRITRFAWAGWAAAAAATIVAIIGWWPQQEASTPTPRQLLSSMIAEASDVTRASWKAVSPGAYDGVEGEVVWSDDRQEGYMRFRRLRPNDAAFEQFQLWIVDAKRDKNPVDGGVFDIPPGADEVIVPIDAKLPVSNPAAFVITAEQPGGVVVSDGPHLLIAAP